MSLFQKYRLVGKVYQAPHYTLYRGASSSGSNSVLIKTVRSQFAKPVGVNWLKNEYRILNNLNIAGIISPLSLERYQNNYALLFEDFALENIIDFFTVHELKIDAFLEIAIQLADILNQLDNKQIIHRNIQPASIFINSKTFEVKLTNFIAAAKQDEIANCALQEFEAVDICYISPEQTGRMELSVDRRTDFYSLGLVLYQLLVGELPFQTVNSLEIIHYHLAQSPLPPHQLDCNVPEMISQIVMKLLAKNPEDRYQNALELKTDLSLCKVRYQQTGTIPSFALAQHSKHSQFIVSPKLYGRERQISELQQFGDRILTNSSRGVVVVRGSAGLGKTVLVERAVGTIANRGYFAAGKYEKLVSTPYSAIIFAFRNLVRQLLTESTEQLELWQDKILLALGTNGKVITDILPELESIVGHQANIPELAPQETSNRFRNVFLGFVRVFACSEHPLILFFDDLQWCDTDSLRLLKHLLHDSSIQHLLVVVAYRPEEVEEQNALTTFLTELEQTVAVRQIQLEPLTSRCINYLLEDTLNCLAEDSASLAELLHKRTQGNPFFLHQLLQNLNREKLLWFDRTSHRWSWNIKQIYAMGMDNYDVQDIIIKNIRQLARSAQDTLMIAACLGNQFSVSILSALMKQENETIINDLQGAIEAGIITEVEEHHLFQFTHSRIQQAIYNLPTQSEKESFHLQIGRVLMQQSNVAEIEGEIFSLVDHWNKARHLVVSNNDSRNLIELNLAAGKKAKASTAYDLAATYLDLALSTLAPSAWQDDYDLTLEIYFEAAETQYLCTNFLAAEQLISLILNRAKTVLEKVRADRIKIHALIGRGQMAEAVDTGISALRLLEVSDLDCTSMVRAESNLPITSTEIHSLTALPEMSDRHKLAAMEILATIIPPIYIAKPHLFAPVVTKMVEICQQFGNSKLSAFAYSVYGLMLCAAGQIEAGYELGKVALALQLQFDAREIKSKVDFTFNTMIRHWKEPAAATIEHFIRGIKSGIEVGDIEHACFHAKYYCTYLFLIGVPLPIAAQKSQPQIDLIQNFKQTFQLNYAQIWLQLNFNLQGLTEEPLSLVGQSFDEVEMLPFWLETKNATSLFALYLAKLILCYLLGDSRQAVENGTQGALYLDAAQGTMCFSSYYFYYSLAILSLYEADADSDSDFNSRHLLLVKSYQQQMELWEAHAPENYQHRNALMLAEIARVSKQHRTAEEYYDLAITAATQTGYLHEAALASELAGVFYLSIARRKTASLYLSDAYHGYKKWGAVAKVLEFKTRYGELLFGNIPDDAGEIEPKNNDNSSNFLTATDELSSQKADLANLDLLSIIKASQAISSEIILDNLLSKMIEIIMENAGAQKSVLILQQNSLLTIAASATVAPVKSIDLPSVPISQYSTIPKSIINYVNRTHQTIILDRGERQNLFANDPYLIEHQPKSVLALPMIYKDELQGIVYLENRLIRGAFTPQKLSILRVILSQVSISIENARLYKNLENHASVQKSLKQKEILLKEIHHRVKNNLLVVSSLLDLQTSYTEDPEVIKLLDNCQNRITSMALVHQHLYGNSELDRIDFAQYIKSLLDNLSYAQSCEEKNINLHCDIEEIELNIETANPCGLIVNELVSNALEHGFRDRESGNIWLRLKRIGESQIALVVQDDGVGFKADFDLNNCDSLGLELACTLVEQLEGTITIANAKGSKIEIVFDELVYQSRI